MQDETTYQNIDETIRQQFESGWATGNPQPIEAVVGEPASAHYLATLEELVHIELEFRWKNRDPLKRPQLEDYLKRFEPLADSAILSRLVAQEVKLRIALGETPTSAEYQERFPEATLDIPAVDQAEQDTGVKSEDDVDTQREMPTLLPGNQGAASDKLDSATMMGNAKAKQKVILEGDFVPGYDLLGELGRGGMGVVYQARDQRLKRVVALKMILSGVHASEEDMQRFQTEAEAVAKLQHPNIVQIFEVGEHKGNPYISLEYQEGGALDKKIAGTPQNIEESAQLIETLARAIAVAHEEEVIHRDLKPANILLSAEGEPKITDFGLAKRMDEDSNQTKSGAVMGTPSYMAPEQAASSNETIGPAADTYALGAILYHMLTGRPPFQAETQLDTLMQVISDEPVPPRRLNSKVPADLETICLKCLHKEIHRRYASAEGLAEDLRRFQAGEPIAARPVSSLERGWKWARRRPAMAGMVGLSLVAAITFVIGGLWYNGLLRQQRNIAQQKTAEALRQKTLAEEQTELAKQARLETRRRMAQANIANGTQLLDKGNLPGALLWFTEALRLDEGNAERERIHRQRLALVLAACAKPKHVWIQKARMLTHAGFTPDFQKVITVHFNGTIHIWDLETGAPVGEPIENDGNVVDVAFDKTGNLLATTVLYPVANNKSFSIARIWDLTTRKRRKEKYRQEGWIEQIAFHPNRNQLMTASDSGKVIIWNTETGDPFLETIEHQRESPPGNPPRLPIERSQLSPDGSRLATASTDLTVRLWDTTTGVLISQMAHEDIVNAAVFSPDGKRLATASHDNTARIWDVQTGLPITPPLKHKDDVLQVIFSSDGRRLATASRNRDARVWDTETGRPLTAYLQHEYPVNDIDFSPDSQFLVTGGNDGVARLWSVASGQLHGPLMPHAGRIQFVEFHRDGRHLLTSSQATAGADGTETRIWDLAASQQSPRLLYSPRPRHGRFIPHSNRVLVADHDHGMRIYDAASGKLEVDAVKASGDIHHFEFSRDGKRVVTATSAGIARVWDTTSLKPLTPPMQNHSPVYSAHFNVDGTRLVTTTKDDAIRIWNAETGTLLGKPITGPYEALDAVFHPDGQVATFRRPQRGNFDLHPVQTFTVDEQVGIHPGTLRLDSREALDFKQLLQGILSPQGNQLLAITRTSGQLGQGFVAKIFDTDSAKKTYDINYDENFHGASFSNDGKLLLLYTHNKARVWNASNGQPISPWIRTGSRIEHAIFSPDGLLVGTACKISDNLGTARIWDTHTGQPLTTRLLHRKPVMALDFTADSNQLLTRADQVRVWKLKPAPHSLEELTVTAQFLSGTRLDDTAATQILSSEQQRTTWSTVKNSRLLPSSGTSRQAATWRRELYSLAQKDGDLQAMRGHQDVFILAHPESNGWLVSRSITAANLGKLGTATADLRELVTRVPEDQCDYSVNYAMLLLRQGDVEAFRRECQSLLKRYTSTTDAMIAERLVKTCCLEPVQFPVEDLRMQLAKRAIVGGNRGSNYYHIYAQLAYGMACYRTGQYDLALDRLKPLGDMTKPPSAQFDMSGKVLAAFFVAMSQHRLGNPEAAQEALRIALKYNHMRGDAPNTHQNIFDWLRCDIIESEATKLLQNPLPQSKLPDETNR